MAVTSLPEYYVQPGGLCLARGPAKIKTLLGSCVGITFWCPELGVGALCHPMLPSIAKISVRQLTVEDSRRYVDYVIPDLAGQFEALGVIRANLQIKLFGGADVLPAARHGDRPTVGRLNCESALRVLDNEGFRVAAQVLGGTCGLNIQLHTGTGEVLLRRLNPI